MFCTSLRKRLEWAAIIPELSKSTDPKLRETALTTHDIALPLPTNYSKHSTHLRLLLLSPISLQDTSRTETLARIERLSTLTGGHDVAIIFLLSSPQVPTTNSSGIHAYMDLQLLVHTHIPLAIPLLPLTNPQSLPITLSTYLTHLTLPPPSPHPATTQATITHLLPHTTTSAPSHPLSEHATNVLSDIVPSLAELAKAARGQEGKEMLRGFLEGDVGEGVIEFWEEEWVVE